MELKVLFLGPARDLAGEPSAIIALPENTDASNLRLRLCEMFPRIAPGLPRMRIAVNQSFVPDDHALKAGDEVAIIPPVSGG